MSIFDELFGEEKPHLAAVPDTPKETAQAPEEGPASGAHPAQAAVDHWQRLNGQRAAIEARAGELCREQPHRIAPLIHHAGSTTVSPEAVAQMLQDYGISPRSAQRASNTAALHAAMQQQWPGIVAATEVTEMDLTRNGLRLTVTTGDADLDADDAVRANTRGAWRGLVAHDLDLMQRTGGKIVLTTPATADEVVAMSRMAREMPAALNWVLTGDKRNWRGVSPAKDRAVHEDQLGALAEQFRAPVTRVQRARPWRSAMQEAGLLLIEKKPDGANRITAPGVVKALPYGDSAALVVDTPPRLTLSDWQRAQPVLENLLGVQGLRITAPEAGRIWIAPPPAVKGVTAYVPTSREMLHYAEAGRFTTTAKRQDMARLLLSTAAAQAAYREARWVLGRTEDGEVLTAPIQGPMPHIVAAGGTGSGKSYWIQWLATMLAATGGDLIICDGKGGPDYIEIARNVPNVKAFSRTDIEHVALLSWLHDEMNYRYEMMADDSDASFRPIYMIFDEYGAFMETLQKDKASALYDDSEEITSMVTRILQKARAAKIHMVFISQTIYAETFPGKQLENIPVGMSLGKPKTRVTLEKLSGEAYDQAKELVATVPSGKPGVGLVTMSTDAGATAKKVATPFGYVPGRIEKNPDAGDAVLGAWREVETEVYADLVSLTPRMGLVHDWPVEVKDRGKKAREITHWSQYGLHELRQLPWVQVGRWHGVTPPVNTDCYDNLNKAAYTGKDTGSAGGRFH